MTAHAVRFARSLAFVGVTLSGCAESHLRRGDVRADAAQLDAGPCSGCVCPTLSDRDPANNCEAIPEASFCCALIGPLSPPDLRV